ncbi:glycosyltransferase family 4 protein [Salinimicrobium flavum]|uniref:Glycosyltransferase family 4 protein n=1 Tax=Salinimicrobium flavum TaxID=1737065 RepID=A0ABW5IVW5_9FLAO
MKLKILHLSAAQNWGGGENHLENLCFELEKKDLVENHVLCVQNGILHKRLKKTGIPLYDAPLANKLDPRFMSRLLGVVKKHKFDLLHIHDSTALTHTVMADHLADLPPFILSKKTSFPIRTRKQTLYKYNYPKVKKILCVSEATKTISDQTINGGNRLEVIYHGTRTDNKERKAPFLIHEKLKLPSETLLIGNIANHIEAKNLETFIMTAHWLKKEENTKLHFVQIGNFSKRTEQLKQLVNDLELEAYFSFLGYIPDASGLIPQFSAMLMTSEIEGIPQVIYESFYHGIPVVSTNVGGIPEVIQHKVNGLLAPAYDHIALGENIRFLMQNPEVIPTFAEISREKLYRECTSEIMAEKTYTEYKKVIYGKSL